LTKSFWTLVVIPGASPRFYKLKMPRVALSGLAVVGLLAFSVAAFLGFNYVALAFRTADYRKMQSENAQLKIQERNLHAVVHKLGDKVSHLESTAQEFQKVIDAQPIK
jgi:hypothetical protein